MNCLIDSHVFLWAIFSPERLSRRATEIILNPDSTVNVSVVTFWELSLKFALGKLELNGVTPDLFPGAAKDAGFDILSLADHEAASFHALPRLEHRDPFDRMLIWQAISRKLRLISADRAFDAYRAHGLKTVW